jgi:hypothetical protein
LQELEALETIAGKVAKITVAGGLDGLPDSAVTRRRE